MLKLETEAGPGSSGCNHGPQILLKVLCHHMTLKLHYSILYEASNHHVFFELLVPIILDKLLRATATENNDSWL